VLSASCVLISRVRLPLLSRARLCAPGVWSGWAEAVLQKKRPALTENPLANPMLLVLVCLYVWTPYVRSYKLCSLCPPPFFSILHQNSLYALLYCEVCSTRAHMIIKINIGISSLDYTTASSSRCFSPLSPLLIDSFLSLIPRAQELLDMTRRTKHASTVQLVQILKSQLATEFARYCFYLLLNLLAIQSQQLLQCTRTFGLTFENFQQAESLSKLMVRGGKTVGMG